MHASNNMRIVSNMVASIYIYIYIVKMSEILLQKDMPLIHLDCQNSSK